MISSSDTSILLLLIFSEHLIFGQLSFMNMPSGSHDYIPLSPVSAENDSFDKELTQENCNPLNPRPQPSKSRIWKWVSGWKTILCASYVFFSFIAIILLSIALLFRPDCPSSRGPKMDFSGYQCAPNGAPPAVARSRGCEFDSMSFHWYPREASHDAENQALLQDFWDEGPWHRYLDNQGHTEIPDNDWGKALTTGWVTRKEHLYHCKHTLRQTHLWIIKGYDPPFNYNHTLHCTKYLLDTIEENPPADFDMLTIQGTPWPEEPAVVSWHDFLYFWDGLEIDSLAFRLSLIIRVRKRV